MKRHLMSRESQIIRSYGSAQLVAMWLIVHKFLLQLCMDQAWKSVNVFFFVSFMSSFDQVKI